VEAPSPLDACAQQFTYCRVDGKLTEELRNLLKNRGEAVLLGAREIGKRYVLNELATEVSQWPDFHAVKVDFPREPALATVEEIRRLVDEAVKHALPGVRTGEEHGQEFLGAARRASETHGGNIVLLVSSVDCIAHHRIHGLLRELQALVKERKLSAILTSEENLCNLVTGREFDCAKQFVLQGFGEQEFCDYMEGRHEMQAIGFESPQEALKILHEECGGNIFLAKAALWSWLEARDCGIRTTSSPVQSGHLREFLQIDPLSEWFNANVFEQFAKTIDRVPAALSELCALLAASAQGIEYGSAPSELELAGLAVRHDNRLVFASKMVARFVRKHYDARRLGDLHARQRDWGKAIRFYRKTPADRRFRPCGADDRIPTAMIIKSLTAALHAAATRQQDPTLMEKDLVAPQMKKLSRVKRLFRLGCRFALGFSHVSFWHRRQTDNDEWTQLDPKALAPELAENARAALKGTVIDNLNWQAASEPLAVLPSVRPDYRDAVVVSTAHHRDDISNERSALLKELIEQFAIAYHHSIANLGIAFRLQVLASHLKIAENIVNALGEAACDPHTVLKKAGEALWPLGYKRVLFSLVDSAGQAVHGSVACANCEGPDIARNTHFSLSDTDIQAWVVREKKYKIVPNWREQQTDYTVQQGLCEIADMGPFVVLPMFCPGEGGGDARNSNEEVFGTIHVERKDLRLPSKEDIEDLIRFGRLIAAAIRQSERLHAVVQSFDNDHDAVLILDPQENVIYANPAAHQRLNVEAGFHSSSKGIRIPKNDIIAEDADAAAPTDGSDGAAPGESPITKVLKTGERKELYRQIQRDGSQRTERYSVEIEPLIGWRAKDQMSAASEAEPALADGAVPMFEGAVMASDERNRTSGVAVQIRDLSGLERVLNAVKSVATRAIDRESVVAAVVETCALLRGRKARLYLIPETDPDLLISERHWGLDQETGDKFNRQGYFMERGDNAHFENWKCIEDKCACLFQWVPGAQSGTKLRNRGVDVIAVNEPSSTAVWKTSWKKPGDYWVDLPLFAHGKPVGKLALDCADDLTPQDLDLFNILAVLLGPIIAAPEPRRQLIERAANRAIAQAAHTIGNKLTALENLEDRYERAYGDPEKIRYWNNFHGDAIRRALKEVDRVRETLIQIIPERKEIDVLHLLLDVVESAKAPDSRFAPAVFQIKCLEGTIFSLDRDLMMQILEEMTVNSRAMIPPGTELQMRFVAKCENSPRGRSLVIRVSDNGPGIPEAKRARVFEAFYTSRPFGGESTGLGLNLVQRVVQAHGGSIRIISPGHPGACFVITFPEPTTLPPATS
jgi:signal transduction histidine kinase